MTPRLTSKLLASALIRLTQQANGFAAVLSKGDESAGAILVLSTQNGRVSGLWERNFAPTGTYAWNAVGPQDIENSDETTRYIERRRQNDPDLWVIELDIPDATQLTAVLEAAR
jgi:hypothetical protein